MSCEVRGGTADETEIERGLKLQRTGKFLKEPDPNRTWKYPVITREPTICQESELQSPEILIL